MENIFNRLQFVKHDEVFPSREEAINYVINKQVVERPTVVAEPMILLYESDNGSKGPNVILAIGSVGNGTASPDNRTFFIDTQKTEEEIVELRELIEEAVESLTIMPLESDTIDLHAEKTEEGTFLSGDVKIADYRISSASTVNYNIIQTEGNKGIYAFVDMDYDPETFTITFNVNGATKEFELPKDQHVVKGVYDELSEAIVLTLADGSTITINVVKLIDEWTVIGTASTTPIMLFKEHVSAYTESHDGLYGWQDLLTADVRIAEHPRNILSKTNDGRELYVKGTADNIYYKEGVTVKDALDNVDTRVSTSRGNLIYKRQDGIYASAMLGYNTAENKLIYTYSDGNSGEIKSVEFKLNGLEFLDDISYNPLNETIVIRYKTADGEYKTMEIPARAIIDEWDVNNEAHNVKLDKFQNPGSGIDILTADAKIYNGSNNILEDKDHTLYVNGISDNIKYDVTGETTVKNVLDELSAETESLNEKIDQEIADREESDEKFDNLIGTGFTTDPHENITYMFESLSAKVDSAIEHSASEDERIESKLDSEIERSTEKDVEHDEAIQRIDDEIGSGFSITNTVRDEINDINDTIIELSGNTEGRLKSISNTDRTIEVDNTDPVNPIINTVLSRRVMSGLENMIIKNSDGLYATVDLDYNFDTHTGKNELILKTTNFTKYIDLKTNSMVDKIYYDPVREAIIIEYTVNGQRMPDVIVPVGDLINEWRIWDGHEGAIQLSKERIASGTSEQDVLKAAVVISDHADNIIVNDGGALYVTSSGITKNAQDIAALQGRMDTAEADIDDLNDRLAEEIVRATDAERILSDEISDEVERAEREEARIEAKLDNEITRSTTRDEQLTNSASTNASNIQTEKERAQAAEQVLRDAVLSEETRAISAETALQTALNNEITRATSEEARIETKLDNEISRATNAEDALQTAISNEVTRATSEETRIETKLDSEITRSTEKDAELENAIDSERERAMSAETALQTTINNEVTRATTEETRIETKLDNEISRSTTKDNELQVSINTLETNLNNEISRAKNAESAITNNLNEEIARAKETESAITHSLEIEVIRATSAETVIQGNVDAEAAVREHADDDLRTLITNEVTRATTAENSLQTAITNETTRATAAESSLQTAIINETNRATSAETVLGNNLNSEITRATSAETALNTKIENETTRATNAENNLQTLLNSEITRSSDEDERLYNLISAETAARQNSDNNLQNAINGITLTFDDTTTVDLNKSSNNVVTANVKVANSDDNIIKVSGENAGIYASARLSYNPGTNKIRIITSNGAQEEIQLNAGALLDDMVYDSTNRALVITYTDSNHASHTINFPVNELFNDWVVDNPSEQSAVELTKVVNASGYSDTLSGRVLLTNLDDNIIQIVNNGLYVSGALISAATASSECTESELKAVEKAIFGNEEVPECGEGFVYNAPIGVTYITNATNISNATYILDNTINNLSSYTVSVDNKVDVVSGKVDCLRSELDITQENVLGISVPECGLKGDGTEYVYEPNQGTNYIFSSTSFNQTDIILDREIKAANDNINIVNNKVDIVSGDVINLNEELDCLENGVGFGSGVCEYHASTGCVISAATSLYNADQLLDQAICGLKDQIENTFGSDTTTAHMFVDANDDKLKTDVRLSHGNSAPGMTDGELTISDTSSSEITDTNALRKVEIPGHSVDSSYNGLYLSNNWDCGEYTLNGAGTPNNKYKIDESEGASNYNYMNNVRQHDI